MPVTKSGLLEALQHFESGGRNIANTHQGTSSGQAQGYNQITTGTWADAGGLKYAPDPLHATKEQQDEIASGLALRRWAPETLDYLRGQGFKVDPNATLGENIAANGGTVASGGPAVASAGGGGVKDDWQSLLGVPDDPGAMDLSSLMSSAVQPTSRAAAPAPSMQIDDSRPNIDQSYALAAPPPEDPFSPRYQQGREARKLSPLGQLFSLPTIGLPPQQPGTGPGPFKGRPMATTRNIRLRSRTTPAWKAYPPTDNLAALNPSPLFPPDPYGRDPVNPPGYEPGGSGPAPYDPLSSIRTPAPAQGFGYGGGSPTAIESNIPPPPAYEPGGGIMPTTPLPPSRPSGLGGLLSSAVAPAGRAAPAAAAPAAQPQSSMFTGIDRQNSGPNDRFRGGGTALNLSGLLGGLFGGGGPAPQPTPPPPPAASAGPRGPARPDMSGIAFDAEGNPSYDGLGAGTLSAPGLQQDPNLAGTVVKPNWWKPLR